MMLNEDLATTKDFLIDFDGTLYVGD